MFLLLKTSILENLMKKLCDETAGAHTCKHTQKLNNSEYI